MSRHEHYKTRRGDYDVEVDHRDRDYRGPGFYEHDHEYREIDTYNPSRERGGELTRFYERDNRSSGALVPVRQEKIIERDLYEVPPEPEPIIPIREIEIDPTIKVTEHEHEHVHHHNHIHIDHAAIHIVAEPPAPPPPPPQRREVVERETLMQIRERRYGGKWNATGRLSIDRDYHVEDDHRVHEERSRSRSESRDRVERTIGYGRYRERNEEDRERFTSARNSTGALVPASPRGSGFFKDFKAEQEGWTVVDVPGTGRRITVEGGADVSWNSSSFAGNAGGIRRSSKHPERTAKGELWTEITKDLVCAEALEEFGYNFEETDNFVYVFDYLHRDHIQDLIDLTKDIRRERVREIENSSRYERSQSRPRNSGGYYERDRFSEKRDYTPYGERDRIRDSREAVYY
ncbi:hypothetical protein AA313_de0204636 [Arthrobotrys entomopaga]|nr:hypothetical protein AA313_de0204636 [Arthrobotrys entomopaga]